jgi:hypothetical protein
MNRRETEQLLRRRRDLTGESLNDGTVDAWTEALADTDFSAAMKAVVAAARTHDRVSVGALIGALARPQRRSHTDPIGAAGCPECDGLGLAPIDDGDGVIRYRRCRRCRR